VFPDALEGTAMAATMTTGNTILGGLLPKEGMARLLANIAAVVAGSLLLWASAKIQVPFYPVPMTLQTLAIMLIAACYGWRLGLATVLLYLAEGAINWPVFSGTPDRGIGLAYMMGPTGGYLVGWLIATALVGWFAERGADKSAFRLFAVMLPAGVIILAVGFAWLATLIGVEAAWAGGVVPFLLGDLLKIAIAAGAVSAGNRLLRRE
jgi:biotin transport system substrate-specific component